MKEKIIVGLQMFVGLLLIVFGTNIFLNFLPMQPGTEKIGAFIGALFQTGYLMSIVGVTYILVGISFILNKFVALMAIVLVPVMLNAFLAHLFLDISGIVPSALILAITITVMWKNRERYVTVLAA